MSGSHERASFYIFPPCLLSSSSHSLNIISNKLEIRFYFQILEQQQEKFLRAQQLISPRNRRSSTPISHHQQHSSRRSKSPSKGEPTDQFRLLENRLKSVEAERKALFDLNSSLQDENSTLKKLAHSTGIGGKDDDFLLDLKILYIST